MFCGGDSLSIELKKKVDDFLKAHNASVQIRQGYGLTECVTASCLTPKDYNRVGSIGVPFPDTYYKIVKPGTTEELDANFEGEICISGPSVMLRYVDNPEETANTLRRHEDGRIWLHTGDLGKMDEDGFVFFSQRMKRMIITSGYNVYPGQLENIIDGHEKVLLSCVIGVKDPYKVQKVKAFVVLRPGFEANDETKKELLDYCRQHIAKYAMPYDIEFRDELPKTLVGRSPTASSRKKRPTARLRRRLCRPRRKRPKTSNRSTHVRAFGLAPVLSEESSWQIPNRASGSWTRCAACASCA